MKSRSRHKRRYDFFFTMALRPSSSTTQPPRFPSHNITKNAETHPPPMRDVIIEQPLDKIHYKRYFLIISVKIFQTYVSSHLLSIEALVLRAKNTHSCF